jgi:hypothetical protein
MPQDKSGPTLTIEKNSKILAPPYMAGLIIDGGALQIEWRRPTGAENPAQSRLRCELGH